MEIGIINARIAGRWQIQQLRTGAEIIVAFRSAKVAFFRGAKDDNCDTHFCADPNRLIHRERPQSAQ